jgi:hypothetical protein
MTYNKIIDVQKTIQVVNVRISVSTNVKALYFHTVLVFILFCFLSNCHLLGLTPELISHTVQSPS